MDPETIADLIQWGILVPLLILIALGFLLNALGATSEGTSTQPPRSLQQGIDPNSLVYFIQAGIDGPIKIGVSKDPPKRLKQLQTANSDQLRILKTVSGGYPLEKSLHRKFIHLRGGGEWFQPHPDLLSHIRSL